VHFHDQNPLMKTFSFLFDDTRNFEVERPDMLEAADPSLDAEGRRWPKPLTVPRDRVGELENTIANLSAELTFRCTQISELYHIRQQQGTDLLIACDEIDRCSKSIDALYDTMTQCEHDAAAGKKMLIQLEKENIALRLQLDKALKVSAALAQRVFDVETAFNGRELDINTAQQNYAQVKAELTAERVEKIRLTAAIEEAARRHRDELDRQSAQFKDRIEKLESVAVEKNIQIKDLEETRAMLAHRCDNLTKTVDALENAPKKMREEFISQAVDVFETITEEEEPPVKVAVTVLCALIVTVQVAPLPEQSPLQPLKVA